MYALLLLYLIATAYSLSHTIAHALAARIVGVEVEEINVFSWGPDFTRVRVRVRDTLWVLSVVPSPGGHVKFRVKGGDEFGRGFDDLNRLQRVLVIVAGNLPVVAMAVVCLGPIEGVRSVWRGFHQIVQGGVSPVVIGVPLVRSMFEWIRLRPLSTGLGIYAAKAAAFNLLPLPPFDGGMILWYLIQWRGRFTDRIEIGLRLVGLLTTFVLICGWFYAIARVLIFG